LLSVFPLILGIVAIFGFVFNDPAVRAQFINSVAALFPDSANLVESTIEQIVRGRGAASVVAVVSLIWFGSGVFGAIAQALDVIWQVPRERGLIQSAVLGVVMVLGVGVVFLAVLVLSAALSVAASFQIPFLGWSLANIPFLFAFLSLILPWVVTFVIFAVVYKYVPNTSLSWKDAWPGAVLASVLIEVSQQLFVWYLRNFAAFNAVYGSIGTVIVFLTWADYAAIVLLIGAEFNATLARHRRGSGLAEI
ncbi:MAG TPA: YihY/virulence factor BrkB family protein, partial [Chloroflexota bacterium]|nr:YihY/virulence factor BrkB family protein [Chloroflexota bacterium]